MDKIYVCSPYRGDTKKNTENAKRYSWIEALHGAIPITPHLYFTTFLDDDNICDRSQGLRMGKALLLECKEVHVYADEVSEGMIEEIKENMAKTDDAERFSGQLGQRLQPVGVIRRAAPAAAVHPFTVLGNAVAKLEDQGKRELGNRSCTVSRNICNGNTEFRRSGNINDVIPGCENGDEFEGG